MQNNRLFEGICIGLLIGLISLIFMEYADFDLTITLSNLLDILLAFILGWYLPKKLGEYLDTRRSKKSIFIGRVQSIRSKYQNNIDYIKSVCDGKRKKIDLKKEISCEINSYLESVSESILSIKNLNSGLVSEEIDNLEVAHFKLCKDVTEDTVSKKFKFDDSYYKLAKNHITTIFLNLDEIEMLIAQGNL